MQALYRYVQARHGGGGGGIASDPEESSVEGASSVNVGSAAVDRSPGVALQGPKLQSPASPGREESSATDCSSVSCGSGDGTSRDPDTGGATTLALTAVIMRAAAANRRRLSSMVTGESRLALRVRKV